MVAVQAAVVGGLVAAATVVMAAVVGGLGRITPVLVVAAVIVAVGAATTKSTRVVALLTAILLPVLVGLLLVMVVTLLPAPTRTWVTVPTVVWGHVVRAMKIVCPVTTLTAAAIGLVLTLPPDYPPGLHDVPVNRGRAVRAAVLTGLAVAQWRSAWCSGARSSAGC